MPLCEYHEMQKKLIREFMQDKVRPLGYYLLEEKRETPWDILRQFAEQDYMGQSFPEEYGGAAQDTVSTSIFAAEAAEAWGSGHLIWSANDSLAGYPIMKFGSDKQKKRYLPKMTSGDMFGCYALTEPDAGSDAASLQTTAAYDKKKGLWTLNGSKIFITNADIAGVAVVFARVKQKTAGTKGRRHEGITAFIIESSELGLKVPGVDVKIRPKRGFLCSHYCDVTLDNVTIPRDNMLGEEGRGFNIAMDTLNNGRINIAAQALGIARRAWDEAWKYAEQRKTFGKSLSENQDIEFRFVDLKTKIEAAWLLVYSASKEKDGGGNYRTHAAMAKLHATDTAKETADFLMEILGGVGTSEEHIGRFIYDDARTTTIYEGASNIQRMTIAKSFR